MVQQKKAELVLKLCAKSFKKRLSCVDIETKGKQTKPYLCPGFNQGIVGGKESPLLPPYRRLVSQADSAGFCGPIGVQDGP